MKIHSKYRQKESEKIIKIKLNILSNIFLLIFCVKPLERREKHTPELRDAVKISSLVVEEVEALAISLGHLKREQRNNLNKLFAILE